MREESCGYKEINCIIMRLSILRNNTVVATMITEVTYGLSVVCYMNSVP